MTHDNTPTEGHALVYQVHLPLSTKSLALITQAIHQYRRGVGSRWRKLPDEQVALIVLAVLRHDQRPADLAAAYGVSHHSVRRWVRQSITTLAAMAPRLDRVLTRAAHTNDEDPLLFDGTCLPVHRPAGHAERRLWCGKHKAHHLRVLTLTNHHGRLLWISAATGARTHEATQAKRLRLPARLRHHDLAIICDRIHTRLDDQPDNPTVITGHRGNRHHPLTPAQHTVNTLLSRERAPNEHAHAHLKNWRILTRLRHGWRHHATTLLRALLVLTNAEINR
ncbi:transposase family protein [Micromonospora sp. NPDC047527]|uniref:transposase family protein n=1 Tax=unclassified Micromonospora TaxID=2617518 RepID=UPI00340C12E5